MVFISSQLKEILWRQLAEFLMMSEKVPVTLSFLTAKKISSQETTRDLNL